MDTEVRRIAVVTTVLSPRLGLILTNFIQKFGLEMLLSLSMLSIQLTIRLLLGNKPSEKLNIRQNFNSAKKSKLLAFSQEKDLRQNVEDEIKNLSKDH